MGKRERIHKRRVHEVFFLIGIIAVVIGGFYGYLVWASQPLFVTAQFLSPGGKLSESVRLEVVATPESRALGLMHRKPAELPADQGMLFIFPLQDVHTFWMRNTLVSLDMIFVDRSRSVVGILRDVPTQNDDRRTVGLPSTYVVELNAGSANRLGIAVGSEMKIAGTLPEPR